MIESSQTKLYRNWSSFQLANSTPPQSVIDNAIAPPARIPILPGAKIYSYLPTATTALYCCFLISVGDRANASRRRQKLCCGQTPEEPPKALQTSECDELLDLARTSCLILVQRQPGKFIQIKFLKIYYCWCCATTALQRLYLETASQSNIYGYNRVTSTAHQRCEYSFLSIRCLASSSKWLKFVETVVCESRKSL